MNKPSAAVARVFFLLLSVGAEGPVGCARKTLRPQPLAPVAAEASHLTGGIVDGRRLGLRYPASILKIGSQFVVVGNGDERVLFYQGIPGAEQVEANFVLGQRDTNSDERNSGGLSASSLASPQSAASDGQRLYIADRLNSRVLIYKKLPTTTFQAADAVLGQPDLTTGVINNTPQYPGAVSAQSLYYPTAVFIKNGQLFVVDSCNHRILIWNTLPTTNQVAADIVIGQPTMTTSLPGSSTKSMAYPQSVAVTNSQMIIADQGNSRILLWNSVPTDRKSDQNPAADLVLGQPDFAARVENNGGLSAASLSHPQAVFSDGKHLFVSDTGNNRVLIWNSVPKNSQTQQRQGADLVLGQPSMITNGANWGGISATSLAAPGGIYFDGVALYLADTNNHRILTWSSLPSNSGKAADRVLGQPDFQNNMEMNPGSVSAGVLSAPRSYALIGTRKIVIADSQTNRILIWNSRPVSGTYPIADIVLGQSSMSSYAPNDGGVSAGSLWYPTAAATDGTRLFVADRNNHRVLIWNSIPTASSQPADVVLGQPNMTSNLALNTPGQPGRVSGQSLWFPNEVYVSGGQLFVSDTGASRVLVWNQIPTVNQTAADFVIGQTSLTAYGANSGGISARTLSTPQGLFVFDNHLMISDYGNNRVLLYNTIPTKSDAAADLVLGQADFTGRQPNAGGASARTLASPIKVFATATHLAVADFANNRILIWKPVPSVSNSAASAVVGQASMSAILPNWNGVTDSSLSRPGDVFFDDLRFIAVDTGNDRIVDLSSTAILP